MPSATIQEANGFFYVRPDNADDRSPALAVCRNREDAERVARTFEAATDVENFDVDYCPGPTIQDLPAWILSDRYEQSREFFSLATRVHSWIRAGSPSFAAYWTRQSVRLARTLAASKIV